MSCSPAASRPQARSSGIKEGGAKLICFAPRSRSRKKLIRSGRRRARHRGDGAGGHIGPVSTSVSAQEILPPLASEIPIFRRRGIGHGGLIAGYLEMGRRASSSAPVSSVAHECIAHPNFKKAFIRASARDAITSVQIDPQRLP
jgi:enoyl-[acyl-carrier protein] reductase II